MTTKPQSVNTTHAEPPGSAALVTISLDTVIDSRVRYVDGESYGREDYTIADAIVAEVADRLVRELKPEVVKHVIAKADAEIVAQVRTLVTEVLAEPFTITDQWGHRSGQTTVRQRIGEQVAEQLKPSRRDGHGSRDKTAIVTVIEKEVQDALHSELSGVVKEARDKVVGSVRDHAASIFATALKDGLR